MVLVLVSSAGMHTVGFLFFAATACVPQLTNTDRQHPSVDTTIHGQLMRGSSCNRPLAAPDPACMPITLIRPLLAVRGAEATCAPS